MKSKVYGTAGEALHGLLTDGMLIAADPQAVPGLAPAELARAAGRVDPWVRGGEPKWVVLGGTRSLVVVL